MAKFDATELPNMIIAAVMTAVMTLTLAFIISAASGRQAEAQRIDSLCYSAHIIETIVAIVEATEAIELDPNEYRPISTVGIDCSHIFLPPDIPESSN